MPQPTVDNVKPLCTNQRLDGQTLHCTFTCPVSGTVVEAQAVAQRKQPQNTMGSRAARTGVQTAMRTARSWLSRAISGAMGTASVMGRMASQVSREAAYGAEQAATNAATGGVVDKDAALVAAFQTVQHQFAWDADAKRWVGNAAAGPAASGFASRLADAPFTSKLERETVARLLIGVARADGGIDPDEQSFLANFVADDLGSVEELAELGLPNAAELNALDETKRANALMIVWALAFADDDLADAERTVIEDVAEHMGLGDDAKRQALADARTSVLDQAFAAAYPDGQRDMSARKEALALAERLGLSEADAQAAEVDWRQRNGV